MLLIKPPTYYDFYTASHTSVFLAGSIEMGLAENWQEVVIAKLEEADCVDFIFSPRRDNWDNSLEQSINNPMFKEQVDWELDHLGGVDFVFFYFDPNTKSPISLLELGLTIEANKDIIVVCPDGFYRKGNVDIVCDRYNIPVVNDLHAGIELLIEEFTNLKE